MTRTFHVCQDVRGAILNFKAREWRNCVTDETGRTLTPAEVKNWFMDQLAEGKKVVPFGQPCEGFSFETGCPGHKSEPDVLARQPVSKSDD